MASAQGIWTFISKDLATPRKKSFFPPSVTLLPSHQAVPGILARPLQNSTSSTPAQQPNTCSQYFISTTFSIRGWRASATSCKAAESTCRCRFESKCECFSVANILSLETCNSICSLCFPEFCGLPQCYHYHLLLFIFAHVTSFVSGPMLSALCLKRLKKEAPFIRLSTLSSYYRSIERKFASSDPWDRIPIHKIIVTMMLLRPISVS